MDVVEEVRTFLSTGLRIADAQTLDAATPLLQRGIIDSIELLELVMFLERRFGIAIDDTEVLPSNLRSLAAIAAFVAQKRAAAARPSAV